MESSSSGNTDVTDTSEATTRDDRFSIVDSQSNPKNKTIIEDQKVLLEIKKRIERTDELFLQLESLKNQITENLTGLLDHLPASLKESMFTTKKSLESQQVRSSTLVVSNAISSSNDNDDITINIVPRMGYIPWNALSKSYSSSSGELYAIEVPTNEPVGLFDPGQPWDRLSEPVGDHLTPIPERIQINSPRLKVLLRTEIGDKKVPQFSRPYIILRPFKELVYQEDRIKTRLQDLKLAFMERSAREELSEDASTNRDDNIYPQIAAPTGDNHHDDKLLTSELKDYIDELSELLRFMDETLLPTKRGLENDSDLVSFSDLWYLFPVGSVVYVNKPDTVQKTWIVIQRTGGRRYMSRPDHIPETSFQYQFSPFVVDCYSIDYDGMNYIPVYGQFRIDFFGSIYAVSSLPVFPFRIAEKEGIVNRDELKAHAKKFIQYTSAVSHQYYYGWTHSRTPSGIRVSPDQEEKLDSEVIVDFERALEHIALWRPSLKDPSLFVMDHSELGSSGEDISEDWEWDERFSQKVLAQLKQHPSLWDRKNDKPSDPSMQNSLLVFPDRIFAYVLRNRKWASLRIGIANGVEKPLQNIIWQDDPWRDLILPEGHKQLISAMVKNHFVNAEADKNNVDIDLIRGKGLITLLHGPPGVGDLGVTAGELEASLSRFFELAHKWGCILLLDEADVFLARRTKNDLVRNSLVSVFLRMLEYYPGILFLTTNRIGTFDEAFKSRINVSLYLPPLDENGTIHIWKNNIRRAKYQNPALSVDTESLIQYAHDLYRRQGARGNAWNGREIKNAFQSALALADFARTPGSTVTLTPKYFEKVSETRADFETYLQAVIGTEEHSLRRFDADNGRTMSWRKDTFRKNSMTNSQSNSGSDTVEYFRPSAAGAQIKAKEKTPRQSTIWTGGDFKI
ncbi:hypothetical protein N0V90_005400 [Kalmusia sp. IMI 367209]|nr:hypothetical protein N0V90_005400 [Kalmusia sp. IMI 367209]